MFCAHCGVALPDSAYFCHKCGVMTRNGVEARVPSPWRLETEVEKTLSTVAKEVREVFNSVRESVQRTTRREPIFCPHCGEKNLSGLRFCFMCGKELELYNQQS